MFESTFQREAAHSQLAGVGKGIERRELSADSRLWAHCSSGVGPGDMLFGKDNETSGFIGILRLYPYKGWGFPEWG